MITNVVCCDYCGKDAQMNGVLLPPQWVGITFAESTDERFARMYGSMPTFCSLDHASAWISGPS